MANKIDGPISPIPENLIRLWAEEDAHISWAKRKISESSKLHDFVEFAEIYMDTIDCMRQVSPNSDAAVALIGLLMRTFDDVSHVMRSAFSGNYRGSAIYCRDLIEIDFLLNFLLDKDGRPEEWLHADQSLLDKLYRPAPIREYLDRRDGFDGRKRKKNFDALAKLGVHPTPAGFTLSRDGTKMIRSGPFKQLDYLEKCMEECMRHCISLSFRLKDVSDKLRCSEKLSWSRLGLKRQEIIEKYTSLTHPSSAPK